ncbi:hypothetical protein AKJ09_09827 [Labilithrix luteola]|uniref:Uncharacterized protein n=1 Tax=Labilithrix luteola TaxID=1391654 RepID=A0A0K1QBN8_9BACT|nr:hypothetical protein [Labilithrix luteola]AKV03164.1 hypothetical protein AKJ09_09827 [Labilithrix luteola]
MRLTPFFRWFDLWVGAYIDVPNRTIYVCPVPTLGFKIELGEPPDDFDAGPYVCPGCHVVAGRCAPGCFESDDDDYDDDDREYDEEVDCDDECPF